MIFYLLFISIGSSSFVMLKYGVGAEGEAIGYAPVGIYNATSIMFSCAELGILERDVLNFGYRKWLFDTQESYLFYTKTQKRYAVGTGILISITPVEKWSKENFFQEILYPQDWIALCGVGFLLNRHTSIGVNLKILYENLIKTWGIGASFDLSFVKQFKKWLIGGVNFKNISHGIYYSNSKNVYPIPFVSEAGILFHFESTYIPFYIRWVNDEGTETGIGIKYMYKNMLWFGYGLRFTIRSSEFYPLHFGLGINVKDYWINYSCVCFEKIGLTHRIELKKLLHPRPSYCELTIKIVEKQRKILVNATVRLEGIINVTQETHYHPLIYKWLVPGKLYILVYSKGYYPVTNSIEVKPGENIKIIGLEKRETDTIKGIVRIKETHEPLSAKIEYKGEVSGEITTEENFGIFVIKNLPYGNYFLKVQPYEKKFIPQVKHTQLYEKEKIITFELTKEKKENKSYKIFMTLHINFEFGKAEILPAFYPMLDSIGRFLEKPPSVVVEIVGHTDNIPVVHGKYRNNLELSQARAEAVKNYLVERFGINPQRLIAKGYGDTEPLVPNDTKEGRAMNRRIEFRIFKKVIKYL